MPAQHEKRAVGQSIPPPLVDRRSHSLAPTSRPPALRLLARQGLTSRVAVSTNRTPAAQLACDHGFRLMTSSSHAAAEISPAPRSVGGRTLEHSDASWGVVSFAMLLALPSLSGGFYADDYMMLDTLEHRFLQEAPQWDLYRVVSFDHTRFSRLIFQGAVRR